METTHVFDCTFLGFFFWPNIVSDEIELYKEKKEIILNLNTKDQLVTSILFKKIIILPYLKSLERK